MSKEKRVISKKAYLKRPNNCPRCDNDYIGGTSQWDADSSEAWRSVKCAACGLEWIDIYTLCGIDDAGDSEGSVEIVK